MYTQAQSDMASIRTKSDSAADFGDKLLSAEFLLV